MKISRLLGRGRDELPESSPADPPVPDRDDVAAAEELAAAGRLEEAVAALAAANRDQRDPRIEMRLLELRHLAAARMEVGAARPDWPPVYADPFPDVVGTLPEISAHELSTEVLGGAVSHHGCLIVRGVFDADQVARSVEAIERTHLRYRGELEAALGEGEELPVDFPGHPVDLSEPLDDAWYHPLELPDVPSTDGLRQMVARQGGTWLGDSPSSAAVVLDGLRSAGVTDAIAGHLGETPVFSLQKSTLRRSLPKYNLVAWHQDGSFLDADVRTMNVWVALSPCGGDRPSPGIELLPRRLHEVLPVDGVMTPHSISYDLVDELAADMPTIVPVMDPGDAMIFDERLLHRTHLTQEMTEIRYALECWFFAPSHRTASYTPLLA
jgi:hypothetical protein